MTPISENHRINWDEPTTPVEEAAAAGVEAIRTALGDEWFKQHNGKLVVIVDAERLPQDDHPVCTSTGAFVENEAEVAAILGVAFASVMEAQGKSVGFMPMPGGDQ